MRTINRKIGFVLWLLVWPLLMVAQATRLPYVCGFEEDEDLSCWVLNRGTANASDKWMFGTASHSEGKRAMYISCDGENTLYSDTPTITVAYLRYKFPYIGKQGNYDFSFDWKCVGNAANSALYCMVCPESALNDPTQAAFYLNNIIKSANKGNLPNDTKNECAIFDNGSSYLSGSENWHNVAFQNDIKVSKTLSNEVFAIVFIWVNNNKNPLGKNMGICIDNVQIASARVRKPIALQVTPVCDDSTMIVTWESPLENFVVEYRKSSSNTWRKADGLSEGADNFYCVNSTYYTYVIQRIVEGRYDVRVRGSLGTDTSAYVTKSQLVMYCPYNHCINYLDLENPNLVCTYGGCGMGSYETPYAHIGYITDEDPKKSRHTINFDQDELDAQTDSMLKVIPDGALGSVRLGNWNTGGEGESMTYTFHVDTNSAAILICKYAIVLEKPGDGCGDPGFKMELFDANDNPISDSELCGIPDFTYSKAAAEGWTRTRDESTVWKDWTSVGINLMKYNGQDIKVRMTTWDCGAGGHFGYAYFTLDCAAAHIETENCGNDAKITCEAPPGFSYRWSDETGKVVSRSPVLEVDAGRHTYTCRVSFIEDSTCYFEVSTISAPRFPVPAFTFEPVYNGDCTNKLRFTNHSHVMNKYEGFERHTSEPCEDYHWYFTRLSNGYTTETTNPSPLYVCPNEGDSIWIRFTAYIGENNACDSTLDTVIVARSIIPKDSVIEASLCEGETFMFGGQWRDKDSTYVVISPNFAGCDSVSTLYLTVFPKSKELELFDSICSTQSVVVGDRVFTKTGNYSVWLKNQFECDSVVNLHLYVNQKMSVLPEPVEEICADKMVFNIAYSTLEGQYDSIWVNFSDSANKAGLRDTMITELGLQSLAISYPKTVWPGSYYVDVCFIQHCCDTLVKRIPFEIRYAASVLEQKWNDVIALLSTQQNGGYSFTQYQWYKDGQPIPGQTRSYLYTTLEEGAAYTLQATRTDGVIAMTCPVYYTYHEQVREYPTLASPSQAIPMRMNGASSMRFVTTGGQVYSEQSFPAGNISVIAPSVSGVYVWQTQVAGESVESHYLIVTNSK